MKFDKLRRILGLESLTEKVNRFETVSKSFDVVNNTIDELAKSFFVEKNRFEARMSDPDNYHIQKKIKEKFDSFIDIHKAEIRQAKKQFNALSKEKESLLKDERIRKALSDIKKQESYQKIKKSYQDGNISLNTFNSIIKGITKDEVTKYADFLLFNEDGELLLLKRSVWEDDNKGAWVIPGGHVDPGEEFEAAVIRELQEESGFNVTECENIGSYQDNKAHIEYFRGYINTKEQSPLLDFFEARDLRWVPLDEICEYEMVFNMRENIERILNIPKTEKVSIIKKAILAGAIPVEMIEKARKGIYSNTYENKKLGRVGQRYGKERALDEYFEPEANLSPEEKMVETKFFNKLNTNTDKLIESYKKVYGNEISADNVKEMSKDYRLNPAKHSASVHEPASAFAKKLFDSFLDKPLTENDSKVALFTGGGSGVGKTYSINQTASLKQIKDKSNFIYDSTMQSFESSKKRIDRTIESGRDVLAVFINRDIAEAYLEGVVPRMIWTGRAVAMDAHYNMHINSIRTATKMLDHYKDNPNISITFIKNSMDPSEVRVLTADEFLNIAPLTKEEFDARVLPTLNNLKNDGTISSEQFDALTRKEFGGDVDKGIETDVVVGSNESIHESDNLESEEQFGERVEKGGGGDPIGTEKIRHDGKLYRKVLATGDPAKDWKLVTKDKTGDGKESETKEHKPNAKELANYAKQTSEVNLSAAIKQASDPKIREAAHKELERRQNEEHPQEKEEEKKPVEEKVEPKKVGEEPELSREEQEKKWTAGLEKTKEKVGSRFESVVTSYIKEHPNENPAKLKFFTDYLREIEAQRQLKLIPKSRETLAKNAESREKQSDRDLSPIQLKEREHSEVLDQAEEAKNKMWESYKDDKKFASMKSEYEKLRDKAVAIDKEIEKLEKKALEEQRLNSKPKNYDEDDSFRKGFKDLTFASDEEINKQYDKDAESVREYLNKHSDEKSALEEYIKGSDNSYKIFRDVLSGGKSDHDELDTKTIKAMSKDIDSFINNNRIKEDLVLNRYFDKETANLLFNSAKNGVYKDKSFSSTSLKHLDGFGDFHVQILAKAGSNVANVNNNKNIGEYVEEAEYLINKNSSFKIKEFRNNKMIVELL